MLACFAGTIVVGMVNNNVWQSILLSAASVAVIAWVVGIMIGMICLRSINEHIDQHRADHPIPSEDDPSDIEARDNEPRNSRRAAAG